MRLQALYFSSDNTSLVYDGIISLGFPSFYVLTF